MPIAATLGRSLLFDPEHTLDVSANRNSLESKKSINSDNESRKVIFSNFKAQQIPTENQRSLKPHEAKDPKAKRVPFIKL